MFNINYVLSKGGVKSEKLVFSARQSGAGGCGTFWLLCGNVTCMRAR